MYRKLRIALMAYLGAIVIWAGCSAAAHAQNVCVSCVGPPASYNCSLELPKEIAAPQRGKRLLQFACIEDIARRYGHDSCSVRKGAVGPCIGERHVIKLAPGQAGRTASGPATTSQPTPAPVQAESKTGTGGKKPPGQAGEAPPRTVVELAERAGKDSQRQLNQAGKVVEGAVKKTWRCITSLFGDC